MIFTKSKPLSLYQRVNKRIAVSVADTIDTSILSLNIGATITGIIVGTIAKPFIDGFKSAIK